jgi:hypothetical protein
MPKEPESMLDPDDLLHAEYTYIAQTAFQANEDRARVITFYLVNLGGFVAALYSSQMASSIQPEVEGFFAGLFLLLSVTGLLTILQLARLRQAWFESIVAMNQIKEYYRTHFPGLKLEQALRWSNANPALLYKPWSISFMLALQVAVLGGVSLGAAVYYFGLVIHYVLWLGSLLAGLLFAAGQMGLYARLLRGKAVRKDAVHAK